MNNTFGGPSKLSCNLSSTRVYTRHALSAPSCSWYSYLATATATDSVTDSTVHQQVKQKLPKCTLGQKKAGPQFSQWQWLHCIAKRGLKDVTSFN